jgi:hypothetical protein
MQIEAITLAVTRLFTTPAYIPTDITSLLWALPICLSIAVVYKAIKLEQFTTGYFAREVSLLFITIIGFLVVVAMVLWGISQVSKLI